MSTAGHGLMIKYGLSRAPTEAEVAAWVEETRRYIDQGRDAEDSGEIAARSLPGYKTRFYKSESDTIATLLALARQK